MNKKITPAIWTFCFVCCVFIIRPSRIFAQQSDINGTITNGETPLVGVTVQVKGTQKGTTSDQSGHYSISANTGDTLIFSYIGFDTKEIVVNATSNHINVQLSSGNKNLNELVVIGYGNQERKDVTGAVSTIKAESIKDLPVASVGLKLQGQAAGVHVNQATGFPGSGPEIRIRGAGSIGAGDDPLYVIDGFPISNDYSKYTSPLSTIDPDDIESITVLKDAASTSIYGSRGANGVILITTKKASQGFSTVKLNVYGGMQYVPQRNRIKMMTAEEFANFRIEARQDMADFNGVPFDDSSIPDDYKNPASLGVGTNWFDALTRAAPMQNYDVSYSNGNDKLRTFVSAGYFNQQGTIIHTGFERYSLRVNTDFNIGNRIKAGVNLSTSYTKRNLAETEGHFNDGYLTQGLLSSPLPPVKQPDGSYTPSITSTDAFNNANPVNEIVNTKNKSATLRTLMNAYVNVQIIEGLSFKSSFNVDISNEKDNYFRPSYVGGFRNPPPQPASGGYNTYDRLNWLNENTLNYDGTFGDHHITGLLGYTIQHENYEHNGVGGSEYADDIVQTIGAANLVSASTNIQEWKLLSYLGRVSYSYKDKYLATATLRSDGSSRFGPDNRWSLFPSGSFGWRVSKEGFFPENSFINDMKLRASYGLAGNNSIGNYSYIPAITTANYAFNNNLANGTRLSSLANNDLGWEISKQLDIGLDLTMWNSRLSFIGEYYLKYTSNMLQTIEVPSSSGFSSAITNIGKVRNKGWEFDVNSRNLTGLLKWQTDFNISFNKNRVMNLGNKKQIISGTVGTNITIVGQPMGMFYGYQFLGLFQSQAEVDKSPHQAGQVPGTVKYKDVDGDGTITSGDETIVGSPYPDFTWGLTNTFSYKNFDLNILIDGSQGGHIYDLYKRFTTNLDGVFNVEADVKDRWRSPEQPGNGLIATTVASTPLAREINSSWVKSSSYACLRNLTLGYTFKTNAIRSIRFYLSGQNLLWITPYKGSAPEISFNADNSLAPNVNYTGYPLAATYTLGANLTF